MGKFMFFSIKNLLKKFKIHFNKIKIKNIKQI